MAIEEGEMSIEDKAAERQAAAEARIKESEEKLRVAEIARARAEGEAEALKRDPIEKVSAPVVVSEEAWQQMESETGLTRSQIQANAKMMDAIAENKSAPVRKAAADAEERARKAEERAARAEGRHSLSRIEEDFYKENPGFSAHRGEVEGYLSKFSEESRNDPKKYAELLADAKIYVRGKVREDIGTRRRSGNDTNEREIGKDRDDILNDRNDDKEELNLDDLDNEGARRLVSNLHRDLGKLTNRSARREKETVDQWKKDTTRDGRGVAIDSQEEFARGNELIDGDSPLGGSRGVR